MDFDEEIIGTLPRDEICMSLSHGGVASNTDTNCDR
jgi:hypothetical protein